MSQPKGKFDFSKLQVDQHTPMDVFVDGKINPAYNELTPGFSATETPGKFTPMESPLNFDQYAKWGGVVSGVGSAVQGMVTSYYSNAIQKIQRQMQAELARYNARQAERAAQSALMATNYRIGAISEKFEKVKSGQKAAMAANGIVLGIGSAAEVTATTDLDKHRSMEEERLNGMREAWGLRTQQLSANLTAKAHENSGAATSWGGAVDSITSSVSHAAKEFVYSKYSKYRDTDKYGVI